MRKLNEMDHAAIILCFYKQLIKRDEQGKRVFIKAAQRYGEERGKRMSLRALRDGCELDFCDYFAYSEWTSTPDAYDMDYNVEDGIVTETVTRCPWAKVFSDNCCIECGATYCNEIDAAIVRGFNPNLDYSLESTMHRQGKCRFYYKGNEITPSVFNEGKKKLCHANGKVVLPLDYHCAHIYYTFISVIENVYSKDESFEIISCAADNIKEIIGEDGMAILKAYNKTNFLDV